MSDDDDKEMTALRYPRRRREHPWRLGNFAVRKEEEDNDEESSSNKEISSSSSSEDDVEVEEEEEEEDDDEDDDNQGDEETPKRNTLRSRRQRVTKGMEEVVLRKSSRTTKFSASMEEQKIGDMMVPSDEEDAKSGASRKHRNTESTSASLGSSIIDTESDYDENPRKKSRVKDSKEDIDTLKTMSTESLTDSDECCSDGDDDMKDPPRIQRILAARTETLKVWSEICASMNTSEIESGSMWHQNKKGKDDDLEERFLVKWADESFLHCSWETAKDLEDQVDNSKTFLATFFRKSEAGVLFTPEERRDGDYFDPAFIQIDRILEVEWLDEAEQSGWALEDEEKATPESLQIVVSKESHEYGKQGRLGRRFYIKWMNQQYDEATFEVERDLILNGIEYKEALKSFLKRRNKPSKHMLASRLKDADSARRKHYKLFAEKSSLNAERRQEQVEDYQKSLFEKVFKNGGQLRQYQAEGVTWIIANYIKKKSCILADEMGLGKTLQCAATIDIIQTQMQPTSCCLIVAPLSTIPHWFREFQSWTNLNTIVYHGSAEDRRKIREWEMVYENERPKTAVSGFLRRSIKGKTSKADSPWMAHVVITTPEMLVTDDAYELSAIDWEVLIVDEAHRLKNHNSKLASTLRDTRFSFNYKVLCTGTPIQNDMKELWTLLNFIDSDSFASMEGFLEKYGEIKSKEAVDELHEMLRPYILRRLKEDAEKNMPPKEETIIEVELTVSQKKYYRALYEKNVKFLNRGKSKAVDGPSLNNLAMQLRKCCNHVCLLNGIEDELKKQHANMDDADFLISGSGKMVLLDKLLPKLREEGHRVLIFSQFKMVLDVLEDYLNSKGMSFGRIDGSITGSRRQAAIDSFQSNRENAPFIMMLSTRAGGVGINLTAADTVIIFDSDWNPQNDLQAQSRCHRIGQKRAVKVYRLLSARTYEMHMFNLSSMKMGLDMAVLRGFESGSEGRVSKEEIEKLLKHGAYALLQEDKDGKADVASNEFAEQDLDSILERRTRTIVHDNESGDGKAGSTFSKATFKVASSPSKYGTAGEVDIDDPDFWKKMLGDSFEENESESLDRKQRRKSTKSYFEDDKIDFEDQMETIAQKKLQPDEDHDYDYESQVSSDDEDQVMASSAPVAEGEGNSMHLENNPLAVLKGEENDQTQVGLFQSYIHYSID